MIKYKCEGRDHEQKSNDEMPPPRSSPSRPETCSETTGTATSHIHRSQDKEHQYERHVVRDGLAKGRSLGEGERQRHVLNGNVEDDGGLLTHAGKHQPTATTRSLARA